MNELSVGAPDGGGKVLAALSRRRVALSLIGISCLALWVHRRALGAFLTPDDLITLEQSTGIQPWHPTPWRWLSEHLYFQAISSRFGPQPLVFHLVNLAIHLTNISLVHGLARRLGGGEMVALLSAVFFGVFPLSMTTLFQAVGINDLLALMLFLLALRAALRPGPLRPLFGSALFAIALLAKESILFLPFAVWWLPPAGMSRGDAFGRLRPMLIVSVAGAAAFALLRGRGMAPAGEGYALQLGANVWHNAMTYLAWTVNFHDPIPDLIRSYDTRAWRIGVVVLGVILAASFMRNDAGRLVRRGAAWALMALLPVLLLANHVYGHYMYEAIVGLALAAGALLVLLLSLFLGRPLAQGGTPNGAVRGGILVIAVCALGVAYALASDRRIGERLGRRVPGTPIALDPFVRKMEVARNAITSMGQYVNDTTRRVVILTPTRAGRVFGVESGSKGPESPSTRQGYNLLGSVLDGGHALRVFYRGIDSVAVLEDWSERYRDFDLFLPTMEGYLRGFGSGAAAHAQLMGTLLQEGFPDAARSHGDVAVKAYPTDPLLRLVLGGALFRCGDSEGAVRELRVAGELTTDSAMAEGIRQVLAHIDSAGTAR